ncbi:hypothetical protein EDD86DRAFT_257172 [Gorgonomyces haynaldii]|nr:hypothetical protein EDD86DRAFT_257172 [Gorgonomyces haynaldii]
MLCCRASLADLYKIEPLEDARARKKQKSSENVVRSSVTGEEKRESTAHSITSNTQSQRRKSLANRAGAEPQLEMMSEPFLPPDAMEQRFMEAFATNSQPIMMPDTDLGDSQGDSVPSVQSDREVFVARRNTLTAFGVSQELNGDPSFIPNLGKLQPSGRRRSSFAETARRNKSIVRNRSSRVKYEILVSESNSDEKVSESIQYQKLSNEMPYEVRSAPIYDKNCFEEAFTAGSTDGNLNKTESELIPPMASKSELIARRKTYDAFGVSDSRGTFTSQDSSAEQLKDIPDGVTSPISPLSPNLPFSPVSQRDYRFNRRISQSSSSTSNGLHTGAPSEASIRSATMRNALRVSKELLSVDAPRSRRGSFKSGDELDNTSANASRRASFNSGLKPVKEIEAMDSAGSKEDKKRDRPEAHKLQKLQIQKKHSDYGELSKDDRDSILETFTSNQSSAVDSYGSQEAPYQDNPDRNKTYKAFGVAKGEKHTLSMHEFQERQLSATNPKMRDEPRLSATRKRSSSYVPPGSQFPVSDEVIAHKPRLTPQGSRIEESPRQSYQTEGNRRRSLSYSPAVSADMAHRNLGNGSTEGSKAADLHNSPAQQKGILKGSRRNSYSTNAEFMQANRPPQTPTRLNVGRSVISEEMNPETYEVRRKSTVTPPTEESRLLPKDLPMMEKMLKQKMKVKIFLANEYIIRKHEIGCEMYFLTQGTVEVVSANGLQTYGVIHQGELGVLFEIPRTASVRAVENCVCSVLTRKDLEEVLQAFPEIEERFRKVADKRMEEIKSLKVAAHDRRPNLENYKQTAGSTEDASDAIGAENTLKPRTALGDESDTYLQPQPSPRPKQRKQRHSNEGSPSDQGERAKEPERQEPNQTKPPTFDTRDKNDDELDYVEPKKGKARKRGKSELDSPNKPKKHTPEQHSQFSGMNLMIEPEQFMQLQNDYIRNQLQTGFGYPYFVPGQMEHEQELPPTSPKQKHKKGSSAMQYDYQNQYRYGNPYALGPFIPMPPPFPNYMPQESRKSIVQGMMYDPNQFHPQMPQEPAPPKSARKHRKHESGGSPKTRDEPKQESPKHDPEPEPREQRLEPREQRLEARTEKQDASRDSLNAAKQALQTETSPPVLSMATPPPIATTSVAEKERVATIHSLEPRLNKITQMTLRLLGGTCCVLSIVDVDRVIWKSSAWSSNAQPPFKDEARYESFCSWVVQDDTGRGVTVLDAKTDPRCTHMRPKAGLEDKKKIGALSIRGPARSQISVIDMNILHEMAVWAAGEIDTLSQQRLIESKQSMLEARNNLSMIIDSVKDAEKGFDIPVLENALSIVRKAIGASFCLLFKCNLLTYSANGPNATHNLVAGQEVFQELTMMTLKKETSGPLLLDQLSSGAVTKDVDQYLNKSILRCATEIVWSSRIPSAIIATFFEGAFHFVTETELEFIKTVAGSFSQLYSRLELSESFVQASNLQKPIAQAVKKNPLPFGKTTGLAPGLMVLEPVFPHVKGYFVGENNLEDEFKPKGSTGIKGQSHAQVLAQQADMAAVIGAKHGGESSLPSGINTKMELEANPLSILSLLNDFTQMIDVLAESFVPRLILDMLSNIGQESGNLESMAAFAHELLFTLDVYNQKTGKHVKARVAIHLNTCSKLLSKNDAILVSDAFHHQTKEKCSYEVGNQLYVRTFMSYRLIGMVLNTISAKSKSEQIEQENGVSEYGSMILSKMPSKKAPPPAPEAEQDKIKTEEKKKSKACSIM